MGVFDRVKDIVTANVNSLLDKAEDPSKMLRLMIQEMEDTIINLKSTCAAQLAEKKGITRELNLANSKIEQWIQRAELALEKEREDLAKEALVEKKNWVDKANVLNKHFDIVSSSVDVSRDNIIQLEKKLVSVKSKYTELTLRARQVDGANVSRIHEMERQMDKMEAEFDVESLTSKKLEDEFSKLEGDISINEELEKLKKNYKKRK